MKKYLIILISIILLFFVVSNKYLNINNNETEVNENILPANTEGSSDPDSKRTNIIDGFKYYYKKSLSESKVKIILNTQKLTSDEIIESEKCSILTSASFYKENGDPIGLFVKDGETIFDYKPNNIMNSVFSINQLKTPRITRDTPKDPLLYAIQTGPLIVENSMKLEPRIINDKNARRILIAIDGNNELIFLTFYDTNNVFAGPMIEDIPNLIKKLDNQDQLNIADATNLDGGSASVFFIKDEIYLKEIINVGSFFCVYD